MANHTLVHESSARETMDSATKKFALTKQAPDSTWDEANRVWLGKEAMRECTSQEKESNVLDLTKFRNEEEAKAKAEFGLQAGFTMKFSAIQNNLKDKYSTTS